MGLPQFILPIRDWKTPWKNKFLSTTIFYFLIVLKFLPTSFDPIAFLCQLFVIPSHPIIREWKILKGSISIQCNFYSLPLLIICDSVSGTAGDSLSYHRNMAFSTKDRDNDNANSFNCAASYKSAWWNNSCLRANLNGYYYHGSHAKSHYRGINWGKWKGSDYSAKRAEMKIRPVDF